MDAAQARVRDALERDVSLAWYTATFAKANPMPNLSTILARVRSAGSMQTQLEQVSRALGLPLRPASEEALRAFRHMKES